MRALAAVLSVLAIATPRAQQRPTFSAGVDVVRVDALVTRGGKPVRDLGPEDFEVRDNGVLQQVQLISGEALPLNVVLAFDLSSSVRGARLADLTSAGRALLNSLNEHDRAGLVTFGFAVQPARELTEDWQAVGQALDDVSGNGQTSLVDGCYAGLMLGASDLGRSLLLVFSDGLDTASWLTPDEVLAAARRADVVTYGVIAGDTPKSPFLADLTDATGGDLLKVKSTTDLGTVFLNLLSEYRQRYLISYTPKGVDQNGWHALDVRVKERGINVRARPGYLAGR
jgi:VWFA-related protein